MECWSWEPLTCLSQYNAAGEGETGEEDKLVELLHTILSFYYGSNRLYESNGHGERTLVQKVGVPEIKREDAR